MWRLLFKSLKTGVVTRPHPAPPGAGRPLLDAGDCTGCGDCVSACMTGALRLEEGALTLDYGHCLNCPRCVEACAPGALTLAGDTALAARERAQLVQRAPVRRGEPS